MWSDPVGVRARDRDDPPAVLAHMRGVLAGLEREEHPQRHFLATYLRTTRAVVAALPGFEDPPWVWRWTVDFADLYFDALDASCEDSGEDSGEDRAPPSRPWRIAFAADPGLPPVAHVLLGMNAHINYDLPLSLARMVPPAAVDDPALLASRQRDHERIDVVLASRVAAEDGELQAAGGGRSVLDRLLAPANRAATRRILREARQKVWHNTLALDGERRRGDAAFAAAVRDLEVLSAARVADLLRPGPVLLRLAVAGFGVTLPPP